MNTQFNKTTHCTITKKQQTIHVLSVFVSVFGWYLWKEIILNHENDTFILPESLNIQLD